MAQKFMYDIIKKQNGEAFAKGIRNYDARIFDVPNLQKWVQYAGRDVEDLLPFLSSLYEKRACMTKSKENPFELLKLAGYHAFHADTLKKQNSIQKFFKKEEELCTFRDTSRYKNYYIIHCIKEGAEALKRSDFKKPDRQDAYGTSVISIQILKSGGFISIKNRYNHTVIGCDNTFDSNPDNIILGLADSLRNYFKVDFITPNVQLPEKTIIVNNQLVRYHLEKEDIYFGDGFYVEKGEIFPLKKDYQFFMGPYLFDLKEKTVTTFFYDDDPFANLLIDEMRGKTLQRKKKETGFELLLDGELFLAFNDRKEVTKARLLRAKHLPYGAFRSATALEFFEAPELKKIGSACFGHTALTHFYAPKVEQMGAYCFFCGCYVDKFVLENLRSMGCTCFYSSHIQEAYFPKLRNISNESFSHCENFEKLYAPKVLTVGNNAIYQNKQLKTVFLPLCHEVFCGGLGLNGALEVLNLPRLKVAKGGAISCNKKLKKIYVPKLEIADSGSLSRNYVGAYIEAPELVRVAFDCFRGVKHLYAPYLKYRKGMLGFVNDSFIKKTQFIKVQDRWKNTLSFGLLNYFKRKEWGR